MSSAYLPDFIANAEEQLETLIPAAVAGGVDIKGLHTLCDQFRQRGVCTFLLTGEARTFHQCAMQSAAAYRALLPGIQESQRITSWAKPFYDAVAGGFWECAGDIARSSRLTWNSAREYEDDFLFVSFLLRHFFLGASEAEARAIVAAHERAAEGEDEAHREVCLALLENDSDRFDTALRKILAARAARVEGMVEREAVPEEAWSWLRYFSSEGLALVKLAERAGMTPGQDYLHVSAVLRRLPPLAFEPDAWRTPKR